MKQEILRIENMNVALGDVTVLTNLHLHLFSGELCCILAPSDGSKAGLAAVLSGQRPVNGTVSYCGRPIVRSFHRQYSSGEICCLSKRTQPFRAFSALDWFSVNCCLQRGGFFPSKSRLAAFSYYTSLLGLSLSPSVPVSSLRRFEQQMTALAAGLMNGATLVVFDEAFLSFSNAECAKMQAIIVLLKQRGIAVLYLAAGVDDLACTADQLLILKLGTVVGRLSKAHGFTKQDVLRFYVNVYNPLHVETNQPPLISSPALFTMRNFAIDTLVPFDLSIHAGELVSIYCDSNITLDSMYQTFIGQRPLSCGDLEIAGQSILRHQKVRSRSGLFVLPPHFVKSMSFPHLSVYDNLLYAITSHPKHKLIATLPGIRRSLRKEIEATLGLTPEQQNLPLNVFDRYTQQKILLYRLQLLQPAVLISCAPYTNEDYLIQHLLLEFFQSLLARGTAILLISSNPAMFYPLCTRRYRLDHGILSK